MLKLETDPSVDFHFNGGAVGVLDVATLPHVAGELCYMPYRSGSHCDMHQALRAGHNPLCTFTLDAADGSFVVESCPGYGRLIVRDVRRFNAPLAE